MIMKQQEIKKRELEIEQLSEQQKKLRKELYEIMQRIIFLQGELSILNRLNEISK